MNKLMIAVGLLAMLINLSVGQTLNEDEYMDEDEGPVHSLVKRSWAPKAAPGHAGGAVHPTGTGESRDSGRSRHVSQPRYFAFPTRYKGQTTKYYYPDFEYAYVPSGHAVNYFEVPISGTFGGNSVFGASGNNFGFGGSPFGGQGVNFAFGGGRSFGGQGNSFGAGRAFGRQGANFAFGGGRSFGGQGNSFGAGRAFGGQGANFAFGGGRAFGGQGANSAFGGARGFGGKGGNFAFPGKW